MATIRYVGKRFSPAHEQIIEQAAAICGEYAASGLSLTLRQVYYQFVARGLLPNRQSEYKRLGSILNDARLAGALDWDYLVDRTRNLAALPTWTSPSHMVRSAADGYRIDLWAPQRHRVEVWIEKDAGIGVIESVCDANDVPYFSCRGYTSVSEIWGAAQRIGEYLRNNERVTILHVGDHDPSGIDMTRDVDDRLRLFITRDWLSDHPLPRPVSVGTIKDDMRVRMAIGDAAPWRVRRIALNYDQVQQYDPPPNPAKTTDARFERYVADTGLDESWELDALDPFVLQGLIQDEIDGIRDQGVWMETLARQEHERALLTAVADNWTSVRDTFGGER